jgi:hypothetical protein
MKPTVLRCPKCALLNQGSTIHQVGSSSTELFAAPFWEDGKRHDHDPNTHTSVYACNRGHRWEVTWKESCWCGWPRVRPVTPAVETPVTKDIVVGVDLAVPGSEHTVVATVDRRNGLVELVDRPLTRREKKALRRAEEKSDSEKKDD